MSFSLRQFRALSLLSLLLCALFAAALSGARSAQQLDARGLPDDFPQPVFGAGRLQLGANVAFETTDDATLDRMMAQLSAAGLQAVRQEFRLGIANAIDCDSAEKTVAEVGTPTQEFHS